MPYCNYCGRFVVEEDRFCTNCGAGQHPEAAETAGAPKAPEAAPPPFPDRPPAAQAPEPPEPQAAAPPPPAGWSADEGPGPAASGAGSPPPGSPPPPDSAAARVTAAASSLPPNFAAMLCYLPGLGWIVSAAVLFFNLEPYRDNRYVRFHAFQGLYLGAVWLLAQMIFFPNFGDFRFFPFNMGVRKLIQFLVVIAQVVGIIKTLKNQEYRLPVVGELAEKSLA